MPSPKKPHRRKHQPPAGAKDAAGMLLGPSREVARRLVVMGYTAREVADTLGITIGNAHQYIALYRQKKFDLQGDDLAVARGLAISAHALAKEMIEKALAAEAHLVVGNQVVPVPKPDFNAAAEFLAQMNANIEWLGQAAQATGSTGVARINSDAKLKEQEREQEFAIAHPDRIPGLGFAHSSFSPHGLPLGGGPVMVFPKTPQIIEAERLRLASGEGPQAEIHDAQLVEELMEEVLADDDPG